MHSAKRKPKISFSIADVPIGIPINELFSLASQLKIDGVEIVIGYKTFPPIQRLQKLSEKYRVPILSIHQPLIPIVCILFYDTAIKTAAYFKAKYAIHPPALYPLFSKKSQQYFTWVKKVAQENKVEVLIENMPEVSAIPIIKNYIKRDKSSADVSMIQQISKKYGFFVNLDTSHVHNALMYKSDEIVNAFPFIKNIHLSDFTKTVEHLPLGKGIMDIQNFLIFLRKKQYANLITLELSPKIFVNKHTYFSGIKLSVEYVRSFFAI